MPAGDRHSDLVPVRTGVLVGRVRHFQLPGLVERLDALAQPLVLLGQLEVGERWHAVQLTVSQEHLVSQVVRARLVSLLASEAAAKISGQIFALRVALEGWPYGFLTGRGLIHCFSFFMTLTGRVRRLVGISDGAFS